MTIVIDLRALQIGHQNRGIGMFMKSILEHLPPDDNDYVFYAFDESNPIEDIGIDFKNSFRLVQTPTLKTSLEKPGDILSFVKLAKHSFRKLKPFKPAVFIQFDFGLGLPKWRHVNKVVIAYDLIPLIKVNEYLPGVRFAWQHSIGLKSKLRAISRSVYYRLKYRINYRVYKRANTIISISQSTATSFNKLLGIDKQRLHTILLAPVLSNDKADDHLVNKVGKPYVLYIGGTDTRKRIEDVVHAFDIARGRGADLALVLAGSEFRNVEDLPNIEGREAIIESSYRDDIHLVGFVSDAEKIALYSHAHAFLFCTTYEGFGLPVIESMAASCPVISYNNSSIPEAAGNAARLVDTGDYVAVAREILSLQDSELRQRLIKQGLAQSKKFSWDLYIHQFKKLIEAPKS